MTLAAHHSNPSLTIAPELACLDTELHIRMTDLPPDAAVTLIASQADPRGREWRSAATFAADADGTLDVATAEPLGGSYSGADPMGLIWSMEPVPAEAGQAPAAATPGALDPLAPTCLRVRAEIGGVRVAAGQRLRLRVPAGLRRTEVHDDGLVGTLFAADEPRPGVVLLGGAEGGMHEGDAALLAGHGYAVLALAYYGLPGLPQTLRDIPLEYFGRAFECLARHELIAGRDLAVIGGSKGGEAALLLGATYPQVRAVVSLVGSGVCTQGIGQSVLTGDFLQIIGTPVATWTHRGREVTYLPNVVTAELAAAVAAGDPVALGTAFEPGVLSTDLVPAATIPVERINGPVLLISGGDDRAYGASFQEVAAVRLASHRHPYFWKHIVHEKAGHLIAAAPYGPTTISLSPGPGITFCHGGTPAADARARAENWREILRFLAEEFPREK